MFPFSYFANYAAVCGCRVIAFEPIPKIIRYLNLTVALNGFQNRMEVLTFTLFLLMAVLIALYLIYFIY